MKEQKLDRFSVAGSCKTETGMYDPRFEHDNCGIGAVVNIKGKKSHDTVANALRIVENLDHRAGKDALRQPLRQVPHGERSLLSQRNRRMVGA